jgi:glycyl-tRNA synthetase beta chain
LPQYKLQAGLLASELAEFLRQRLISLLEEQGMAADLVQAVAGSGVALQRVLADPADARQRAALLLQLRSEGRLSAVQAVVQRASKLAEKGDLPLTVLSAEPVVNSGLFSSPSEKAMLTVLQQLEPIVLGDQPERYGTLATALAESAPVLAAFFDGDQSVMVMADDPALRANRLNLLGVLRNQASVLADFSRLQG